MKKTTDTISVIIPVYNVEPYVRRCLDSVLAQTYRNLEVLLVDDGSEDGSGSICDEYAQRDSRFRVFHKKNSGLSSALNAGLRNFAGDYLCIVDSDDWIEPDMVEVLHEAAKRWEMPISVAGFYKDTDAGSVPMVNSEHIPSGVIPTENMLLYPLMRDSYMGFCGYVWNKLYAADTIKSSGLLFDENITYGMDVLFYISLVLLRGCEGTYTDRPLYHYYQRDSAISKRQSVATKKDILAVYKRVEHLLVDNGYAGIAYWARGFYCYHAWVTAQIAHKTGDSENLLLMQNEIRARLDDYVRTNEGKYDKIERMKRILDLEVV